MEKQYRNLGFVLLALIPLTFFGFYKTYFIVSPEFRGTVDAFDHAHAVIACCWILLLILQPLLIRYAHFALHRTLGKISYVVFPALILSFIPQMVKTYHAGILSFLIQPLFDGLLLSLFYILAIRNTRNTAMHMRYMIVSAILFLGPTAGRISYFWIGATLSQFIHFTFLFIYLLLAGLILMDRMNGKRYRPYLVAFSCFVIYHATLYIGFSLDPDVAF